MARIPRRNPANDPTGSDAKNTGTFDPEKVIPISVWLPLLVFWILVFVLCFWLIGTHRHLPPAARMGFAITLSALAFLVVCKIFRLDSTANKS